MRLSGLSPRVRGNRRVYPDKCGMCGSIPACAGEPPDDCHRRAGHRVYPRVCGGTRRRRTRTGQQRGLSPRVRGNQAVAALRYAHQGSIPACAGEPSRSSRSAVRMAVYPRVCGGTKVYPRVCGGTSGLSPRVRGNPVGKSNTAIRVRSIPACAGEPPPVQAQNRYSEVYPRVCGGTQ